jgi:hypothetical protein
MRRSAIASAFLAAVAWSLVACGLVSGLNRLSEVDSLDGGADSASHSLAEDGGADSSMGPPAADSGPDSSIDSATGDSANASTDSSAADGAVDSSTDSSTRDSGIDSSVADSGVDSSSPTSIVRVQAVAPGWASSPQTTLTLAEENAGDLLVAGVYFAASATITITDSLGNSWSPTSAYANTTASCNDENVSVVEIFYAGGIAAGGNVVTVAQSSGTAPLGAYLVEYSGARAAGALDGVSGGSAASSTVTMSAGNLSTTSAHDLVVALFAEATTSGTMTAGPGFSAVDTDGTFFSMFEDDLPTGFGPGVIVPTANEPGGPSDCWVAAAASFRVAP